MVSPSGTQKTLCRNRKQNVSYGENLQTSGPLMIASICQHRPDLSPPHFFLPPHHPKGNNKIIMS